MELCSMLCADLDRMGAWGRMDTHTCMAKSPHCSPKPITTLLIGNTPVQNILGRKKKENIPEKKKKKRVELSEGRGRGLGLIFIFWMLSTVSRYPKMGGNSSAAMFQQNSVWVWEKRNETPGSKNMIPHHRWWQRAAVGTPCRSLAISGNNNYFPLLCFGLVQGLPLNPSRVELETKCLKLWKLLSDLISSWSWMNSLKDKFGCGNICCMCPRKLQAEYLP